MKGNNYLGLRQKGDYSLPLLPLPPSLPLLPLIAAPPKKNQLHTSMISSSLSSKTPNTRFLMSSLNERTTAPSPPNSTGSPPTPTSLSGLNHATTPKYTQRPSKGKYAEPPASAPYRNNYKGRKNSFQTCTSTLRNINPEVGNRITGVFPMFL